LADTARQTRELLGWPFGAGIYFSYVFAALWLGDAMWWWVGRASYERRPKWLSVATHAYIFFIIFNGAIVFETGITRPTGIVACTMLAIALLVRQGQAATRAILLGLSGAAL
jgi:hypothetical protein